MGTEIRSLCVFCGANAGIREAYVKAAWNFGAFLAEQNIRVVYGGGNVGLMGALADSTMAAGGEVIGVIPRHSSRTKWAIVASPSFVSSALCMNARR